MTSKKPVLLVGNGVRAAKASDLIYDFIRKTNIPTVTTMNAVDIVQDEYRIGFIGTYGQRISNMILEECDLLISVGARLSLRQIGHIKENFAPKAKLIRVDVDQFELGRQIKENEESYNFDAGYFMRLLLDEEIPSYKGWWNKCFEAKEILKGYDDVEGNLCINQIAFMLPENPIVAVDVGQNQCWTAQSLWLRGTKGRILIGGGYGAMGCGLPFAIGASISTGNGHTFCITGDGGLQMNIQELEVLKREKLPIKILVINNKVLGKISEIQHGSYCDRYAQTTEESGYSVPDFVKIAKAYGIKAVAVENYKELDKYSEWIKDEEPCLIDVSLSENTLLVPKIKWETGEIKPDLDDEKLEKVKKLLG